MIKKIIDYFREKKYRIKYLLEELSFLKIYNSPFEKPKINIYWGDIAVGVPYFLPRKLVRAERGFISKPIKYFGFDWCGLGWKSKWSHTDIRHEWNPVFSLVFFGKQLAITFTHEHYDHYWSAWVYYNLYTGSFFTKEERLEQCVKEFPLIYKVWEKEKPEQKINYYTKILKPKYLNLVPKIENNESEN